MTNITKKITPLLLTAAMCLSCVPASAETQSAAADTPAQAQSVQTVQTFTIDEAMKYAKEHSLTMAAAKAGVDTAKAQKDQVRITYRDTKRQIFGSDMGASSDGTYLLLCGYTYKSAIFGYAAAQRSVVQAERSLENLVINNFYIYLNNSKVLKLRKDSLESAKTRRLQAETKYANGTISQLELEQFKIAEKEAQNNFNKAQRTVDNNMRQLKATLNYPLDQELRIVGTFERTPMDTTTPEQAIEKAKNSISRVNAEETLALAAAKRDAGISHYTSNSVGARTARSEFAQAELDYKNTLNSDTLDIYEKYSNMANAYEGLDLIDQNLAFLEKSLEAAKRSYELGMTTVSDYLDAVQKVDDVRVTMTETEINCYILTETYKMTYDCENTITQEEDRLS